MPGRNRTGPMGMGPMTGRGAGWCAGHAGRDASCPTAGPGYGMGFGWGRGYGGGGRMGRARGGGWHFGGYGAPYCYPGAYGAPEPEAEKRALAEQSKALQGELERIRKRLSTLESEPTTE